MRFSVKDWRLFRTSVCTDLNQPGFPESMYVVQWVSATVPVMYRIETDRFNKPREGFIFFRICEDVDGMIAARGRSDWLERPYPISLEECDTWFETVFFIQWSDWRTLQQLFGYIDNAIQKDTVYTYYEAVRKRLFLTTNPSTAQHGLPTLSCLSMPRIIRQVDYY
ncbi:hypothetical protein Q8A73_012529 [Channa argus]|nr:hypothetical protein Q8A73_012529 [Channa argus]